MKFGMVFKVDVYDFEKDKAEVIFTRPCDFIQVQRWKCALDEIAEEEIKDAYVNYATVCFAIKREKRAKEFGLSDGPLTVEEIEKMTERFSVYVGFAKDDDLPIQAQTK